MRKCGCESEKMLAELVNHLVAISKDSARFVAAARLRGIGSSLKVPERLEEPLKLAVIKCGVANGAEKTGLAIGKARRWIGALRGHR